MKKIILTTLFISLNFSAIAANNVEDVIKKSQLQWEEAKYKIKDKSLRLKKYEECANDAKSSLEEFKNEAQILIWQGICTASQAELLKLSALSKAKEAKSIFEQALKIDDKALSGSGYVNLGVLYHRVPSWPIGFGDKKLAEENFKKALEIAPKNIDANYFYALFLESENKKEEALKYLKIAADAPSRNRPFADMKRKEEVQNKINELLKK